MNETFLYLFYSLVEVSGLILHPSHSAATVATKQAPPHPNSDCSALHIYHTVDEGSIFLFIHISIRRRRIHTSRYHQRMLVVLTRAEEFLQLVSLLATVNPFYLVSKQCVTLFPVFKPQTHNKVNGFQLHNILIMFTPCWVFN